MKLESLDEMIGTEVAVTEWMPITQERIDRFAEVTEDRQWIHIDRERAMRDSPYGGTVAHGFLTLSLLSHLSHGILPVEGAGMRVNYGLNSVRFPAPVPAGARIRARFVVQGVKYVESGADVTFSVTVEVENSIKPCCVAQWIVRYNR